MKYECTNANCSNDNQKVERQNVLTARGSPCITWRMSDLGLTHVALPVRSLETSIEFYARYANMHVIHRRSGVAWISDRTRPFAIVLIETSAAITPLLPFAHLGVGIASREEVDKLCAIARAQGCLAREPEDSGPPVGYWAFLRDPDGHTLELAHGQELALAVESANSETK